MTEQVRRAIALTGIALAIAFDYWLIHRPEPHSISEYNPIKAKLGKEELILSNPNPSGAALLTHQGAQGEAVEIFFDRGVLSPATRRLLQSQPWAQTDQPQYVSYTTLAGGASIGPPCRTSVSVRASGPVLSEVRLFQDGIAGGENHREFSLKTPSPIEVDFLTAAEDPSQPNQAGCRKLLQVGDNQIGLTGMIPLSISGDAESAIRFKFMPSSSAPIWKGSKGLFEPFQGIGFAAATIRLSPIGAQQKLFQASAPQNANLMIEDLLAGSDTLELRGSGTGWVTVNDRLVSPTLSEWISQSSLRAALAGWANLAVLCAAIVFGGASPKSAGNLIRAMTGRPRRDIPAPENGLVVFLCHCSEDKLAVREIRESLRADGFQPWLDEEDIFPARMWDREIEHGLRSSQAVIVCWSKTFVRKEGYVQKELRWAIEIAKEKPDGTVFLIPLRLEDCEIASSLAELQFIDWFKPNGHEKLTVALREREKEVGIRPPAAMGNQ